MKQLCLILTAGWLVGCAHYQRQPLAPENSAAQLDARRLDDAGLKSFVTTNVAASWTNWPPAQWDVNALTLAAYYFHPDLAVARAQWRVAVAGITTAGGRPNPVISGGPGFNFSAAGMTPWMPFGAVDWPLETAGKRGQRIAAAENISASARWDYFATAWQLRRGVRSALVDFAAAGQRAALLQKQFAAQEEISRRLEQRCAAGAIARSEMLPAQMALNATRAEQAAAQAKLAAARSQLAEAVGVPLAALDGINLPTQFPPPPATDLSSAEIRRTALLGRADIRAALADYAASEANLRLEIAKQFPDVHLNPGYQFDQGDNKWTFGLTLELPVLNQNQGPIAEAKAQRELAAAKFLQLQAQTLAAIDRAVAALAAARTQLRHSASQFAVAEQRQKSLAAQLKAGAAEPLDLLAAEVELQSVRLAQLEDEVQFQSAVGALEDAVQRPADAFAADKFLPAISQP